MRALIGAIYALAFFTFFSASSFAADAFPLQLDTNGLSAEQIPALQKFVEEANGKLPDQFKEKFKSPIPVTFTDIEGARDITVHCDRKDEQGVEMGYIPQVSVEDSGDHVFLNHLLISEIMKGSDLSQKLECNHGSYYQMALATLLHETSHLYDRKSNLSEREIYRSLTGWEKNGSRQNQVFDRSPDAYEYYNPRESFAVNMEYFLLDPEYRCRRPSVWKYLASEFRLEVSPSQVDCQKFNRVYVGTEDQPTALDPSRIYQVQYLLAAPGSEIMSRWGHAMIRLVVCDPKRKEVGPECLNDISHHIVISYRANIGDLKTSTWKGLVGKYPSQLYFLRMGSILEEYGHDELRDLKSFPLKMTDDQKDNLIQYLREQYWGYQGKYYFLTNNCATETRKAIEAAYQDDTKSAPLETMLGLLSPIDLQNLLQKADLIDEVPLTDEKTAVEKGYLFPSKHRTDLQRAFEATRAIIPARYQTVDEFLNGASAQERKSLIQDHLDELKADPSLALSLFLLELQFDRINSSKISAAVADLGESHPEEFKRGKDAQKMLLPWNRLIAQSGYGVPSVNEIDRCAMERLKSDFTELSAQIDSLLAATYPALQQETQQIDGNMEVLMKLFQLLGSSTSKRIS